MKPYRRAITYGTFDIFHIGHLNLLNRAADYADELFVFISTDEFNSIKGKKCLMPYADRAAIVNAIKGVTATFPELNWEQKYSDIIKLKTDVFIMGHDWTGKFDNLKSLCDVIYLPRTEGISTSSLKKSLSTDISRLQNSSDTPPNFPHISNKELN